MKNVSLSRFSPLPSIPQSQSEDVSIHVEPSDIQTPLNFIKKQGLLDSDLSMKELPIDTMLLALLAHQEIELPALTKNFKKAVAEDVIMRIITSWAEFCVDFNPEEENEPHPFLRAYAIMQSALSLPESATPSDRLSHVLKLYGGDAHTKEKLLPSDLASMAPTVALFIANCFSMPYLNLSESLIELFAEENTSCQADIYALQALYAITHVSCDRVHEFGFKGARERPQWQKEGVSKKISLTELGFLSFITRFFVTKMGDRVGDEKIKYIRDMLNMEFRKDETKKTQTILSVLPKRRSIKFFRTWVDSMISTSLYPSSFYLSTFENILLKGIEQLKSRRDIKPQDLKPIAQTCLDKLKEATLPFESWASFFSAATVLWKQIYGEKPVNAQQIAPLIATLSESESTQRVTLAPIRVQSLLLENTDHNRYKNAAQSLISATSYLEADTPSALQAKNARIKILTSYAKLIAASATRIPILLQDFPFEKSGRFKKSDQIRYIRDIYIGVIQKIQNTVQQDQQFIENLRRKREMNNIYYTSTR